MLTIISSKHSHHLQPLLVDQLQPKLMDKEISQIQHQQGRLTIPRPGRSTTKKWVKLFLPLLGLLRAGSQITAQRGLSTTGSRQRTTLRQVHRECHSILQHHRANNKKWTIQYLLHCVGEKTFVKCMDADALMKILILVKKNSVFENVKNIYHY